MAASRGCQKPALPHAQADPDAFAAYLRRYGNTICGRHPIGVLLQVCLPSWLRVCRGVPKPMLEQFMPMQMLKHNAKQHRVAFRQYDQSSRCTSFRDSSVSYAAAVVDAL